EQCKEDPKPYTQPHIVPIPFGYRIAEPLVRHLVRDKLSAGTIRGVTVENVRCELHPAFHTVRLNLSQLLVRVRTDTVDEKLKDWMRVCTKRCETGILLLRKDPGRQRNAVVLAKMFHCKRRHGERYLPRADRGRLFPGGLAQIRREIAFFRHPSIGNDLVVPRGGNSRRNRSLHRRMVDCREVVSGSVRPRVGKESAIAVLVLRDQNARRRDAVVADGERKGIAGRESGRQVDLQPVTPMLKRQGLGTGGHRRDGHSFVPLRRGCPVVPSAGWLGTGIL